MPLKRGGDDNPPAAVFTGTANGDVVISLSPIARQDAVKSVNALGDDEKVDICAQPA